MPLVLRAIFVENWRAEGSHAPFPDQKELFREIKSIRPGHNLAPESVMKDAVEALRRQVDVRGFDCVLALLPEGAADFWAAQ